MCKRVYPKETKREREFTLESLLCNCSDIAAHIFSHLNVVASVLLGQCTKYFAHLLVDHTDRVGAPLLCYWEQCCPRCYSPLPRGNACNVARCHKGPRNIKAIPPIVHSPIDGWTIRSHSSFIRGLKLKSTGEIVTKTVEGRKTARFECGLTRVGESLEGATPFQYYWACDNVRKFFPSLCWAYNRKDHTTEVREIIVSLLKEGMNRHAERIAIQTRVGRSPAHTYRKTH
jgi:hypothetical protein